MTEIQRIKNEGWLSDSFFNSEIKDDFRISEDRKMIWAILMDLLKEFQRVCEKNDLNYSATCGTLLGAVRHKGFIPWDDDIDVVMPRTDYEKIKKLKKEFKYPYNLVWADNEEENGYSFLKLRNSNTTGISKAFKNLRIDHGLFLDIFPLDRASLLNYHSIQQTIKGLIIENSSRMKRINSMREKVEDDEIIVKEIRGIREVFNNIEKFAQKDNQNSCNHVAIRTISFYSPDKLLWREQLFSEYLEVPFEEMTIKIPCGWNEILNVQYGDWRKMPPLEDRGNWHNNAIFDSLNSYCHYLNHDYSLIHPCSVT